MKKLVNLLIVVLALFSLTACGGDKNIDTVKNAKLKVEHKKTIGKAFETELLKDVEWSSEEKDGNAFVNVSVKPADGTDGSATVTFKLDKKSNKVTIESGLFDGKEASKYELAMFMAVIYAEPEKNN